MGGIPRIPQELLSQICSNLVLAPLPFDRWDYHENLKRKTMLSISLASSSLHDAVKPYLYRTVSNPDALLLRTLLDSSIAHMVQSLCVEDGTTTETDEYKPVDPNYAALLYLSMWSAMSRKGLSDKLKVDIHRGIREGLRDALYAFLLILCPKVRLWYVGGLVNGFRNTLVARTVQEMLALGSGLQQVETVGLFRSEEEEEEVFDLAEAQMILSLPNVRKVIGRGVGMPKRSEHAWRMRKCPKMRELGFKHSAVNVQGFHALLCAYENLETLSMICAGPEDGIYDSSVYGAVGNTLRQYGTKLVNLELFLHQREEGAATRAIGSLAELTSLRKLTLSYQALFGGASEQHNRRPATWLQQVLPVSLERLDMSDSPDEPERLNEQLKALISDGRYTALRTVQVYRHDDGSSSPEDLPAGWKLKSLWQRSCLDCPAKRNSFVLTKDG